MSGKRKVEAILHSKPEQLDNRWQLDLSQDHRLVSHLIRWWQKKKKQHWQIKRSGKGNVQERTGHEHRLMQQRPPQYSGNRITSLASCVLCRKLNDWAQGTGLPTPKKEGHFEARSVCAPWLNTVKKAERRAAWTIPKFTFTQDLAIESCRDVNHLLVTLCRWGVLICSVGSALSSFVDSCATFSNCHLWWEDIQSDKTLAWKVSATSDPLRVCHGTLDLGGPSCSLVVRCFGEDKAIDGMPSIIYGPIWFIRWQSVVRNVREVFNNMSETQVRRHHL